MRRDAAMQSEKGCSDPLTGRRSATTGLITLNFYDEGSQQSDSSPLQNSFARLVSQCDESRHLEDD